MLLVGPRLWIISDTHFGHENIKRLCGRPDDHEDLMLERWASAVGPRDQILHLGDLVWKRPAEWQRRLKRLPGEKYLIKGNHDKQTRATYERLGFTIVEPFISRSWAFTHYPISSLRPGPRGNWHTNVHGHIHNNDHRAGEGSLVKQHRYINVSIEVMDYRPCQLGELGFP